MIIELKDSEAKLMPWKNGGGETHELYRLSSHDNSDEFILRISKATVHQSGPFSEFPHIDRILCLVSGQGMILTFKTHTVSMNTSNSPLYFKGEESVDCQLVNGTCIDFNVMVDRRYGRASLEINTMTIEEAKKIHFSNPVFIYQDPSKNLFIIKYLPLDNISLSQI